MTPTRGFAGWIALGTFAVALVVGCGGPEAVRRDDLALGDDVAANKTKKKDPAAHPEGQDNGTTLGDPAEEPAPEPPRSEGGGDNTAPAPPAACVKDAECMQAGRICTAGACVKGCRMTSQCPTNQTCTSAGQCEFSQSNVECYYDVDCDLGAICSINDACVPGCYTSYDCPTGQTCSTAGQCKVATTGGTPPTTPPECTSDGACNPGANGSGKICSAQGACVAGCHKDNQCPGATICVTGKCK